MIKKIISIFPLLLIILLSFALRWYAISSVAPGVSIDELDYSLNAKSFVLSGKDLSNTIFPLQVLLFKYPKTDDIKAELPYLIHIPFDGIFPFSIATSRIPYIFLGVGSVLLLYAIAKELFGRKTGIAAGFLGAINPYMVVLQRTGYEVVPAIFFYLLGLYLLIKLKGRKVLLSFPFFLFAFYSYIGTKLIFLPFIFISCFFIILIFKKQKDKKYYLYLSIIVSVFLGIYLSLTHFNHTGARLGELLMPNTLRVSQIVDTGRKLSITSPLTSTVFNKISVYTELLIGNFFQIFSGDYLFMTGDGFFRLYNHGVIYYIDSIFLLAGLIFLFGGNTEKKKLGLFITSLIVVGTLPQVFYNSQGTSPNYAHVTLIFPFLILLTSIGVTSFLKIFHKGFWEKIGIFFVICIYSISLIIFIQAYFFQYPLHGYADYQTRLLSKYITLATNEKKNIIVTSTVSVNHFKKYLFYSNSINKNSINSVKNAFRTGNIQLGNVKFSSCNKYSQLPKDAIVIEDAVCGNSDFTSHSSIPLIIDGGVAYKIYNDTICNSYNLKRYPFNLTLFEINVESLSKLEFCQDFITR